MIKMWSPRAFAGLVVGVALAGALAFDAAAAEMMSYKVVNDAIPQSLTGKAGDPAKGKKIAISRKKGNCLACHAMPIPEQADHGEVGPSLVGVASRMSAGEMRVRIVNPKLLNADTIMPAFYRADGLHRVLKKWQGKTVISAQDIEDVIAYLLTLKDG